MQEQSSSTGASPGLHNSNDNYQHRRGSPNLSAAEPYFPSPLTPHHTSPGLFAPSPPGFGYGCHVGSTNATDQSHFSDTSFDTESAFVHGPQFPEHTESFVARNHCVLLGSSEKDAEASSPCSRDLERSNPETYPPTQTQGTPFKARGPSTTTYRGTSVLMSRPYPPIRQATQAVACNHTSAPAPSRHSVYPSFGSRFADSESASTYRKHKTRFDRKPYRPPDTDATIGEIENDRQRNVERIYNAMTRGDVAKDNVGSIAMKRWVHKDNYTPEIVEAYAHKVLDCLLAQAKLGFRGWEHNDYVADDRKQDDEDRDVSCAGRLENIVRALEEEKTVCEDVMNSACQIRMFVNAPKAYANRKFQNRVGNSKRGRPRDEKSETETRPSKARKHNKRQSARGRTASSASQDAPYVQRHRKASHDPHFQPHQLYGTPPAEDMGSSNCLESSPIPNYPTPQLFTSGVSRNDANAMAARTPSFSPYEPVPTAFVPPHIPQALYDRRSSNSSIPQHSSLMSPLPPPPAQSLVPVTPGDGNPTMHLPDPTWQPAGAFSAHQPTLQPCQPVGIVDDSPSLDFNDFDLSEGLTNNSPYQSANLFEQYPAAGLTMTDFETGKQNDVREGDGDDFQAFWNRQQGVQNFQYHERPKEE